MVHNGYDYARKRGFGRVKVGKQLCRKCGLQHHEDKRFWKNLLMQWQETLCSFVMMLRDSNVAWKVIEKITGFLVPCSKDTVRKLFNDKVDPYAYTNEDVAIVHYDEQHPKKGRTKRFRLTLLDHKTRRPIADGLFEDKEVGTIEKFLRTHLDVTKPIVIITDGDEKYPSIFQRIWGRNFVHQKCLMHLNKLIVKEYGRNPSLQDEFNKYCMLNIFYNREKELEFLQAQLKKYHDLKFMSKKDEFTWLKAAKKAFFEYLRKLENERRRQKVNLPIRSIESSKRKFEELWTLRFLFPKYARARLEKIQADWECFTAFHRVPGCPATNNAVENFYSASLETHRKKQLRTDRGLINQMKLAALKRAGALAVQHNSFHVLFAKMQLITT